MKAFVILSVLVAGAMCARLENTYIPPANAQHAGGYNLDTPKVAQASNVQYQQQSYQQPGLNQGTFTSVNRGNGFQSVSAGSHSAAGNGAHGGFQQQQSSYQAPQQQQSYGPPAQQQQQSYNNYQQSGSSYQNQAGTTPIPILECKKVKVKQRIICGWEPQKYRQL